MMVSFWESDPNKRKLIECVYEYYLEHPIKAELMGMIHWKIDHQSLRQNVLVTWRYLHGNIEIQLPSLHQETEADVRIIHDLYWALKFEYDSHVVLMSDTDVLVLLLRYCAIFLRMKLKNLYIKIGTGTSARYLPFHEVANILGEKQCLNLLKAHIATGYNWLSKLGSKSNALHTFNLLDSFGESDVIGNDLINATEEYLMSVMRGKDVSFKTFDEYRYHQYVTCSRLVKSLVPSSYCIRNVHIMCLFYLIRRLSSLLDTHFVSMDPRNYSWLEKNGFLLPDKCLHQ